MANKKDLENKTLKELKKDMMVLDDFYFEERRQRNQRSLSETYKRHIPKYTIW